MFTKLISVVAFAATALAQSVSFTAFATNNCVLTSPDAGDTVVNLVPGQCVDFAMVHSFQAVVTGPLPDLGHSCRIHYYPELRCANNEFKNQGPLEENQTTECVAPRRGDFFSVALVC
ncbi:hypothetical protein HGRIS_000124 [Hohenbuehelia grisea]|uniref:Uncharacterized protein n=1 Tax=Hohenbuehelia grisea TaxID=104357 RepID=A0ABR3JS24_9AGAR